MTGTKIKRSQIATFVNVSSTTGAVYKLLGLGVTTGKVNMNPKTTEETYIDQDTANISIDSYAPTMPVEMTAHNGDDVFEFIDTLRKNRAVLDDAETDIVEVDLYETSASGSYPARKQNVSIQIDDWGGDGGTPAKINFTFNYMGNATSGSYNVSSGLFA
jgi:hypothetical protein